MCPLRTPTLSLPIVPAESTKTTILANPAFKSCGFMETAIFTAT